MFIDKAKIFIKAGKGGNGAISFRREKYIAAGGPDGGDGGKGGNVVFRVELGMTTLMDFKYKRKYAAQNGEDGMRRRRKGRSGDDIVISVPQGTIVKDAKSGRIIADLSTPDKDYILAHGGNGGWGNDHFATAVRQTPNFAKNGQPGDEREIILELVFFFNNISVIFHLLFLKNVNLKELFKCCHISLLYLFDYLNFIQPSILLY